MSDGRGAGRREAIEHNPEAGRGSEKRGQACNINDNRLGRFSELEYHVPAIGEDTGKSSCEDVSAVWAYRGTWPQVRAIAEALLGVRLHPEAR